MSCWRKTLQTHHANNCIHNFIGRVRKTTSAKISIHFYLCKVDVTEAWRGVAWRGVGWRNRGVIEELKLAQPCKGG